MQRRRGPPRTEPPMHQTAASPGCGSAPPYPPTSNAHSPHCEMCHARPNRRLTAMSTNRDTTIRGAGLYAALLVALALLVAACGGSNSPGAAGGGSPGNPASASAVAYSTCMRTHGVPEYPDPDSNGNLPKG